jgi:uncharacterized damage-inducible protein DinB
MNWTELIKHGLAEAYGGTQKLIDMVADSELGWKPATGKNWMTVGQLLMHISNSCGAGFKGFVTGDWGLPEGMDMENLSPEQMMPPAEKLPAVGRVAEAKKKLEADKKTAYEILGRCSEDQLANQDAPAPWDPMTFKLGQRLLQMVQHLTSHKHQLFYYLKLQGKPVNTGHLWGM